MTEMQAAVCGLVMSMTDDQLRQALYILMEHDYFYGLAQEVPDLLKMLYAEA